MRRPLTYLVGSLFFVAFDEQTLYVRIVNIGKHNTIRTLGQPRTPKGSANPSLVKVDGRVRHDYPRVG